MERAAVLVARGVGKRYSRRRPPALTGLDLEVPEGSITALVGPNGAGKSTLIKAWMGFERPTSGQVLVDGLDPFRRRQGVLAMVGYIPQATALYRSLTVADHIELAATFRPDLDRDLARRRLDDLGIPLAPPASHLSTGQQAQVSLALLLATRARILLLDEPLAALDPLARREFLYLLVSGVRESGATAVLTSHVVTDVEQACDRLVILGDGRKLLDEDVATAVASHRVAVGEAPEGAPGRVVASYLGLGEILVLLEMVPGAPEVPGLRPATLEELMLGYLAAGRPGMVDRVRAGMAGR
ncbi:MAG: ABC transporter ATP-binding protein [Chloroflexota bacterium]